MLEVDARLSTGKVPSTWVRARQTGDSVAADLWAQLDGALSFADGARLALLLASGGVVRIDNADRCFAGAAQVAAELRGDAPFRSTAKLCIASEGYASEANDLVAKSGSHFVWQLLGEREWSVRDSADPCDMKMSVGRWLYLPANSRSRARSGEGPSAELVITVEPHTHFELLEATIDAALAELRERPEAKRTLPFNWVDHAPAPLLLDELVARLEHDATKGSWRLEQRTLADAAPHTPRLLAVLHRHQVDGRSRVRVESSLAWSYRVEPTHIVLQTGRSGCELPPYARETLEFVAARTGAFTVAELPGDMDDAARTTLARILIMAGLLVTV